ncbi:hypothetical protein CR513_23018, partial [Mucuna pruriens]
MESSKGFTCQFEPMVQIERPQMLSASKGPKCVKMVLHVQRLLRGPHTYYKIRLEDNLLSIMHEHKPISNPIMGHSAIILPRPSKENMCSIHGILPHIFFLSYLCKALPLRIFVFYARILSIPLFMPFSTRTFHRLIRSCRNSEVANNSQNSSFVTSDSTIVKSDNGCIRYPKSEQAQSYELQFELIHLLPEFHGLACEDPQKHHKEFHNARNLISNMQFGVRGSIVSRVVNEIIGQHHISSLVRVCDICASVEHPTDACSTLQEIEPNNAEVVSSISSPMISTQTRDMVLTLCKMYLRITKDSNHHLHLDNDSLCNLYNIFQQKCECNNSGLANTDWIISHRYESTTVQSLHKFDLEIDMTLYRLRKARSIDVGGSSSFISIPDFVTNNCTTNHSDFSESNSFDSKPIISNNKSHELEQMENNNRMLKELATSDYLQLEPAQSYELKSGLIHLLPKFHGLVVEDPHKHLKEFHGISEDYIKMKAFPFSLDGATKD